MLHLHLLFMSKVARGNAAEELKTLIKYSQYFETTLGSAFPKTIEENIEAITNLEKSISTDSDYVKLRTCQAVGDSDKVKHCIEKHSEDITRHVNVLSAANKHCRESGLTELQNLKETGQLEVFTPFHEFYIKLEKDATKCFAEINKGPQCANKILEPGLTQFTDFIENKTKSLYEKIARIQIRSASCFQLQNKLFTKEFESLINVVKICSK